MSLGSVIGALRVVFGADTAAFEKGSDKAARMQAKTERSFRKSAKRMTDVGKMMSVGLTAPLLLVARKSIGAGVAHAEAVAQIEAGLASMGNASGRSLDALKKNALELESASSFNADAILSDVTAQLLTFGEVADTQFDRAQQAALDMSTRLKTDLKSSAILVGKALNDPIKGLTAMTRVGITFTDQQKQMIKGMTEAGDVAGAQAVILAELERQYGGSAKAARDAAPGSDLTDQWRKFNRIIGSFSLKVLPPLTDWLGKVLEKFNNLSPKMQKIVVVSAAVVAAVGPIIAVLGTLFGMLAPLAAGFSVLTTAVGASAGVGLVGSLTLLLGPLGLVVAAITAGAMAWKKWLSPAAQAKKLHKEMYDVMAQSVALRQQSVALSKQDALAKLDEAKAIAAKIRQMIKEREELLKNKQAQLAQAASTRPTFGQLKSNANPGLKLANEMKVINTALKAARDELAENDAAQASLIKQIDAFNAALVPVTASVVTYTGAVEKLTPAEKEAAAEAERLADAHANVLKSLKDEIAGNTELTAALKIGQGEYDITAEKLRIVQSGFMGSAAEARQLAIDVLASREALAAQQKALDEVAEAERRRAEAAAEKKKKQDDLVAGVAQEIMENAKLAAALKVSQKEYEITTVEIELMRQGITGTSAEIRKLAEDLVASREPLKDINKDLKDVQKTGVDAFTDVANSFEGLARSLQSGDIVGIITGILGALDSIGGAVGGFKIAGLNFGGKRAAGGPVTGGKSYLVGERGPEIFTPSNSGGITPNHKLASAGGTAAVTITPSPYFDARVDGRAAVVAKPIATVTAMEGANQYNRTSNAKKNRSLV